MTDDELARVEGGCAAAAVETLAHEDQRKVLPAVAAALRHQRAEGLRMACDHVPDGHTRRILREIADRIERGEGDDNG